MRNIKMFKKLVIVMLSLVMVAVCSTSVFAADDDAVFTTVDASNNATANNSTGNESEFSNVAGNNTNSDNTANSSLTSNSTTNSTTRNATNNTTNNTANAGRNVSNTNTLAKTGLSNTGEIVALILVVCGVSAISSYKKVNDYKKL